MRWKDLVLATFPGSIALSPNGDFNEHAALPDSYHAPVVHDSLVHARDFSLQAPRVLFQINGATIVRKGYLPLALYSISVALGQEEEEVGHQELRGQSPVKRIVCKTQSQHKLNSTFGDFNKHAASLTTKCGGGVRMPPPPPRPR